MGNLGEYIAELRESKGWSQRELAKRTKHKYTQTTISKLESGIIEDPGIGLLIDLAEALKVPVFSLVLAYQGKATNFKDVVDSESLRQSLYKAIDTVLNNCI